MDSFVKVFTRYDYIPRCIIVPSIKRITAKAMRPMTNDALILNDDVPVFEECRYYAASATKGLCGVQFITYGRAVD